MKKSVGVGTKVKSNKIELPDPKGFEGQYQTRVRRMKVYVMRLQNYTLEEMVAELPASKSTVVHDLKQIDAALERAFDQSLATRLLNEKLMELEGMQALALAGVRASKGNDQIGYLNTAGKMWELQVRLLQDAGVLPKWTSKHELTGAAGTPLPIPSMPPPVINVVFEKVQDTKDRIAPVHGRN